MSETASINSAKFVKIVQPLLERQDLEGLVATLKKNWTKDQICGLLHDSNGDVKKVAALAIGFVGCKRCLSDLADLLKDPDPVMNEMAEHAMWSIWFRGSTPDANNQLARGAQALNQRELEQAIHHFNKALAIDPEFPEAFNQRAIAHYLAERYEHSILDCRRAIERNPFHFGAWAGMGHSHAHLNCFIQAIDCYERALDINPRLDGVQSTLDELREQTSL